MFIMSENYVRKVKSSIFLAFEKLNEEIELSVKDYHFSDKGFPNKKNW